MIRFRAVSGIFWILMLLQVWAGMTPAARAQGSRKDDIVFNSRGVPLAGATVRVCTMPASGQPCTPLALIYSDAALTQALANPTTTDGLGNYNFYAAPGKYMIEISGPGITTKQLPNVILPSDPSSPTFNSISSTGNINAFTLNLSGNLNVNGNSTVAGTLASGTLNLSNQGTAPGTASSGTVNLYTKSADKRLYYKDDTGTEIGPIASGSGAQTNVPNTFTAPQNIDADFHTKGPNPFYDIVRYGGYIGSNYWNGSSGGTTGTISGGSSALTIAAAQDFANGNGILILGAGAAPTISTPTMVSATAQAVVGGTSRTYAVVAEDWFGGRVPSTTTATVANTVATQGVQSISLSACNRASGVVTCTTSATHNIQSGAQINMQYNTTGDGSFEGVFTTTSASGTTFTYNQYDFPDASGTVTHGTVQVGSRVLVKWNKPTADNTVLRTYIYMCTTTCALPANAANFTLEGVAIGNDGSFVDMGYPGLVVGGIGNGDVPNTMPTATTNRWLSTTITSGGGTTSLTLAGTATNAVAGAKVFHDNSPNIIAACNSFPNNGQSLGGVITIPLGTNSLHYFPIASTLDLTQCPGQTEIDFGHQTWQTATIVPKGGLKLKGLTTADRVQGGAFFNVNTYGVLIGDAYPMIYVTPGAGSGSSYETLIVIGAQPYQTLFYQDQVTDGSGVTSMRFQDVHLNAGNYNTAYVMKGGFGFWWDRGGWSGTPVDFNGPPAILSTTNCGPGFTGHLFATGLHGYHSYLFGGGYVIDTCGQAPTGGGAGSIFLFDLQSEGLYAPVMKVNTGGLYPFQTVITNAADSDPRGGSARPMIDYTNGVSFGSMITNFGCPGGNSSLFEVSTSLTAYAIETTQNACNHLGAQVVRDDDSKDLIHEYRNWNLKLGGSARAYAGQIASPAAPTNVVQGGAGTVPIGVDVYTLTAVDNDGFETLAGPGFTYTAVDSVHNAQITVPNPFPTGAVGLDIYRNGVKIALISCGLPGSILPQVTVPGSTVTDSGSLCGASTPATNLTGLNSMSVNGVNAAKYKLNSETFSSSPRGEQNVFLPGALTATWTGSTWITDKAITVTRVQVQVKTAPVTCSPNAIVRVTDGSTPINVTIAAAASDSGALTQNYAAGATITTAVQTAAAGCGTSPADANVTIQYRMQ